MLAKRAKVTPEKMSGATGRGKGRKNKAFFLAIGKSLL